MTTNFKIEYKNEKLINFIDDEGNKEIASSSEDRFGNPFFQINLYSWCSISRQKRAKTLSIFLKMEDKTYKSIIEFNDNDDSKIMIFENFSEVKKIDGKWVNV
ncbi:MAG: hypothetical protein AM1032_000038 [Mycoplasmataceae bacterium]|nr:MAG: hypothetical protein AM1032_000038 [Mycoplasmataceae bacterium]